MVHPLHGIIVIINLWQSAEWAYRSMKIIINLRNFLFVVCGLLLVACSTNNQSDMLSDGDVKNIDIPAEYAGINNPLNGQDKDIKTGEAVYKANCASCHGDKGAGDGPAAISLHPAPPDLIERQQNLSDAYLFWRIAEGGMMAPFNSVMPSWKDALTEDQIWQLVAYIRSIDG
jgi:cytochrome c553